MPWSAYRRPRFCSSRGTYIDNPQINTWWVKRSSWKGPTEGALPWRLMSHFSLIIPNFNAVTLSKSCFTDWYFRLEGIRRRYRGAARIWKTIFRVDIATCYPSHLARMSSWLSSSTHLSPLSATLGRKKRQHVHPNLSRFRDRASPFFRTLQVRLTPSSGLICCILQQLPNSSAKLLQQSSENYLDIVASARRSGQEDCQRGTPPVSLASCSISPFLRAFIFTEWSSKDHETDSTGASILTPLLLLNFNMRLHGNPTAWYLFLATDCFCLVSRKITDRCILFRSLRNFCLLSKIPISSPPNLRKTSHLRRTSGRRTVCAVCAVSPAPQHRIGQGSSPGSFPDHGWSQKAPCITTALFVQSTERAHTHRLGRDQHEIASYFLVVEGFVAPQVDYSYAREVRWPV